MQKPDLMAGKMFSGNVICGGLNECGIMINAPENLDLDEDALRQLYEKESGKLRTALIGGASWEDMREQRHVVTELAIALHRKRKANGHPAGNDHRPS